MNDDLKPGGSGIILRDNGVLRTAGAQAAFMLAVLVAFRVRDRSSSQYSKLAAQVIADDIHDLAQSWAQADKLKE